MAHIEIVTIEYNGYKEPWFTGVTYESFDDIDGCLDYFIEISPDNSSKERKIRHFKEKLAERETIRLVQNSANPRLKTISYYLFTNNRTDNSDIAKWLTSIKETYGANATDGPYASHKQSGDSNPIYDKRWPGVDDLGSPEGFEDAMNVDDYDFSTGDNKDE